MRFVSPNDPILLSVAQGVPIEAIQSDSIQKIIDHMLEVSQGERKEKRMVGLAAPQVGIPLRIICVDTHITQERMDFSPPLDVFINPHISWYSEEMELFREGCFSTGHFAGIVPRSKEIRANAYDRKGNRLELSLEGYTARIFQHEVDHLNGLRFPDRITNPSHLHWVDPEKVEEHRAHYDNWPHTRTKEEWLSYIAK
ncbi:MAG: peptide deformylase [Chlamydiia bacterium]|nr:peptide deformylase [Chlamydiia bacterium]